MRRSYIELCLEYVKLMYVKLCLDASQSFHKLALFSVGMYFWANVTYRYCWTKISHNVFDCFASRLNAVFSDRILNLVPRNGKVNY